MENLAYTSGFSLLAIVAIIAFLFYKLKHVSWYSVSIYAFLAVFWLVMSLTRTSVSLGNHESLPTWAWPIIVGSYQFTQVMVRIPLGMLSRKIRSRKLPILLASSTILMSGIFMVGFDFSLWTIILATIATGVFGATYGMQNQYWSENYNIKAVFITVAMITILPSFGALGATFIKNTTTAISGESTIKWILIGALVFLTLIMIVDLFFKEKTETIRLDNVETKNSKIFNLKLRNVFSLATSVVFVSISYNMVNATSGSHQDSISYKTNTESTVLTIVAIAIALITALALIRMFKSFELVVIGHIIQLFGFVLGLIYAFYVHDETLKWSYLIIMTIGFTIFQNTLVGVTLHFDHKNALLVLGIWLTVRSAATGVGQVIGEEVNSYSPEMIKWLLIPAISLTVISLIYSTYRYLTMQSVIYRVVDQYESNTLKSFI